MPFYPGRAWRGTGIRLIVCLSWKAREYDSTRFIELAGEVKHGDALSRGGSSGPRMR